MHDIALVPPGDRTRRFVWIGVILVLWMCGTGAGLWWQTNYERTPGPLGEVRKRWIDESVLTRTAGRGILVMAVHPHCPCTESSVDGLASLVQDASANWDVWVLAFQPDGADATWAGTPLLERVRELGNVRLVMDDEGGLAASLGLQTSGHLVAYDASGQLVFSGGLTAGRGLAGPSEGLTRLRTLIAQASTDETGAVVSTPVYGCGLANAESSTCCRETR